MIKDEFKGYNFWLQGDFNVSLNLGVIFKFVCVCGFVFSAEKN